MNIIQPSFIMHVGPMASGKTSALLAYVDRCKYQKRSVSAYKPQVDSRFSELSIVSHGGWSIPAIPVKTSEELKACIRVNNSEIIAVDEAFMIEGIAEVLVSEFRRNKTIVVSSLDLSYSCTPFAEIEMMMPYATAIVKHRSVCTVCGKDALYTYKHGYDGKNAGMFGTTSLEVGGLDKYEPRCFLHHPGMNEQHGKK